MSNYTTNNRSKYYLKVHIIFVCKYRKKLLHDEVDIDIKSKISSIAQNSDFVIDIMETDKDHIHLLISYPPHISVTSIVRKLKQETTVYIWKNYESLLSKHFWKERTFWSDGYFACSIGEASPNTIRKYIEEQGN